MVKTEKKILIVEDDPDNQELLQEIISYCDSGYTYVSVNDGESALCQAEKADFDLVFMDMSLPSKDGYETVNSLRKNVSFQKVPIIGLTAHAMKGIRERVIESGCTEYLSKPCLPMDLIKVIKKYLDDKQKLLLG